MTSHERDGDAWSSRKKNVIWNSSHKKAVSFVSTAFYELSCWKELLLQFLLNSLSSYSLSCYIFWFFFTFFFFHSFIAIFFAKNVHFHIQLQQLDGGERWCECIQLVSTIPARIELEEKKGCVRIMGMWEMRWRCETHMLMNLQPFLSKRLFHCLSSRRPSTSTDPARGL